MATNFDFKTSDKGYVPFPMDTPLDVRTRVNTFADIASIPNPFVGMQVYVVDSGEMYLVKQLDEREEGLNVEHFINISTDEDRERSLARVANSDNIESIIGPVEGVAYLTSYVFTRSTSVPDKPKGGKFKYPYPTPDGQDIEDRDENWHDTVPTGKGAVYMSYCIFCSDPSKNGEWTEPKQLTDSANFQVEFTARDLKQLPNYTPSKYTGNETEWRNIEEKKGVTWGDENDIEEPLYMATAVAHNDVWEDWTVVRIKGEKGDKGDKGENAKVSIKGKFSTVVKMAAEWDSYRADKDNYSPNLTEDYFVLPLEVGDGYVVNENGCLYVYNGEDSEFNACWTNVGMIQGDSAYLYVRYSNNADGSNMWDPAKDPTPGRYIGIKASELPLNDSDLNNPDTFKPWTLWQGDDGWGYEQVFILTHKTNGGYTETYGPSVPSDTQRTPDYLPLHGLSVNAVKGSGEDNLRWADRPLSTSEAWPLCWVVTRKVGKEYSPWKGDANERAILYSKYTVDGIPGTSPIFLEIDNDQVVLPLENGVVDPEYKTLNTVTTTMYLFEGNNPITADTYKVVPTNAGTVNGSTVTFDLNVLENVTEVNCIAEYKDKPYSRKVRVYKTNNAYEIIPSESILIRNKSGYISSTKSLTVVVKKWDSVKNEWLIPTDKKLFVKYFYVSGEPTVVEKTISDSINVAISAKNITAIRFYLVDNNGDEIIYEQIGVLADGQDGDTYKTSYAFVRCDNEAIANVTVTGGDWKTPIPEPVEIGGVTYIWEDTVPSGEGAIWVTTRQFKYGDNAFDPTWSSPKKMADSANFEVEFSAGKLVNGVLNTELKPELKSLNEYKTIADWKAAHSEWNWNDDVPGAIWMATSVKRGATWSDWSVVRVKGEKGERGADGTSVNIKGTVNSEEELNAIQNPAVGDGYILGEDLWVYTEERVWKNVGPIKGPAGSSMYLYVRCSDDDATPKELLKEGETGRWMGYYVSNEPKTEDELQSAENKGMFTWARWNGQDGFGYEQIYLLTTSNGFSFDKGPLVTGLSNDKTQDFLPEHGLDTEAYGYAKDPLLWSDIPLEPNDQYPYCWETRRKVSGLVNGKWTEVGDWVCNEQGRALLYNRYVTDGVSAVYLELSNDFAAVPIDENGNVDPDLGTDLASTSMQLYDGGVKVPDDQVKYSVVPGEGFTATCDDKTVTVNTLTNAYVFVACKAEYNGDEYFKNFRVQKRDTAWRIVLDGANTIRKIYNENGNLQIVSEPIGFSVEKWNDIKWEKDSSKKIFVSYSINGNITTKTVENGAFDFSGIDAEAVEFRVFITNDNTTSGMRLDIESIGYTIDGKSGKNAEDTYSIELTNDFGIVPLEANGEIDKEADDITTQIKLVKGAIVLGKDDKVTYSINVDSSAIELSETGALTIYPARFAKASDIPTSIVCSAKHGNVTLEKTFHLTSSRNAYELIPFKHMLERDVATGYLVEGDRQLSFTVKKWNTETNVWENAADGLYLHVDCEHIGTKNHTTNVSNTVSNGAITLNLSEEKDLKSIRVYLSKNSNLATAKTNYLAYDDIGVYANGEDGNEIEFLYYLSNKEEVPYNPTPKVTNLNIDKNYQIAEWTPSKYISAIDANYYSCVSDIVISSITAAKWTDDPQSVGATNRFQYVAQRKKINGIWQEFATPTLWSSYGEDGQPGGEGPKGDDAVVTQLTNPASIVNVIGNAFVPNIATTGLQVRSGVAYVKVDEVSIVSGKIDGVVRSDIASLIELDPDLVSASENTLTFTLKDGLKKDAQIIELELLIKTSKGDFTEIKTICVQRAEQACYFELSNDVASIAYKEIAAQNVSVSTTLSFYEGKIKIEPGTESGLTYSFTCENCDGNLVKDTITVTSITGDTARVIITAKYKNNNYVKTFNLLRTNSKWELRLNQNVINVDNPAAITGKLFIDNKFTEKPSGVSISYFIDDATTATNVISGTGSFEIPLDTVKTVTKNIRFDVHAEQTVVESETIGVIHNGVNAEYYQIDANHRWVVKEDSGTVITPKEKIKPIIKHIVGNEISTVSFAETVAAGYRVYYKLNNGDLIEFNNSSQYNSGIMPTGIDSQLVFYLFKGAATSEMKWVDYVEIDVVKNGKPATLSDSEKSAITKAVETEVLANLEDAYYTNDKIDDLVEELQGAIAAGDSSAIAQANYAVETANAVNESIETLNSYFVDGKLTEGHLNKNDIYSLSIAALGSKASVPEGSFSSDSVFAQHLTGLLGTFVTIKAEQIDTKGLSVESLNTKPGAGNTRNAGSISIESNTLSVYNQNTTKEVVRISGSNSDIDYDSKTVTAKTFAKQEVSSSSVVIANQKYIDLSTLIDGEQYNVNGSVYFNGQGTHATPNVSDGEDCYTTLNVILYYAPGVMSKQDLDTRTDIKLYPEGEVYLDYRYAQHASSQSMSGNFKFDENIEYKEGWDIYIYVESARLTDVSTYNVQSGHSTFNIVPLLDVIELNSNGLRLLKDGEHYITMAHDGSCEMKCGNYGFRISNTGIQFIYNGSTYTWTPS